MVSSGYSLLADLPDPFDGVNVGKENEQPEGNQGSGKDWGKSKSGAGRNHGLFCAG